MLYIDPRLLSLFQAITGALVVDGGVGILWNFKCSKIRYIAVSKFLSLIYKQLHILLHISMNNPFVLLD
jgi:hypothetical protein